MCMTPMCEKKDLWLVTANVLHSFSLWFIGSFIKIFNIHKCFFPLNIKEYEIINGGHFIFLHKLKQYMKNNTSWTTFCLFWHEHLSIHKNTQWKTHLRKFNTIPGNKWTPTVIVSYCRGRPRLVLSYLEGVSLPRNSATINWLARHDVVVDWAVKLQHKQKLTQTLPFLKVATDQLFQLFHMKVACKCIVYNQLAKGSLYIPKWPFEFPAVPACDIT